MNLCPDILSREKVSPHLPALQTHRPLPHNPGQSQAGMRRLCTQLHCESLEGRPSFSAPSIFRARWCLPHWLSLLMSSCLLGFHRLLHFLYFNSFFHLPHFCSLCHVHHDGRETTGALSRCMFSGSHPDLVPTAQPSQLWENITVGALRSNSKLNVIEKLLIKQDGKATNNKRDQKDDFWFKLLLSPQALLPSCIKTHSKKQLQGHSSSECSVWSPARTILLIRLRSPRLQASSACHQSKAPFFPFSQNDILVHLYNLVLLSASISVPSSLLLMSIAL